MGSRFFISTAAPAVTPGELFGAQPWELQDGVIMVQYEDLEYECIRAKHLDLRPRNRFTQTASLFNTNPVVGRLAPGTCPTKRLLMISFKVQWEGGNGEHPLVRAS